MAPVRAITCFVILVLLSLIAARCTSQEDMDRDAQVTAIRSYLLAQTDPATGQPYEYAEVGGVFRQFWHKAPQRDPLIGDGSEFSIMFSLRTFSGSGIGTQVYWSNIPEEMEALREANPDLIPEQWPASPLEVRMGATQLSGVLKKGLRGCAVGDTIRIFAPFTEAFGNEVAGGLPRKSTVVYMVSIGEAKTQ